MAEQLGLFDARWLQPDAAAPPLCVRESRRARRLTLRVLPPHTLELVVPRGARAADVAAFVHQHRRWIERARREIAAHYALAQEPLPTRVALPAIDQSWLVRYESDPQAQPRVRMLGDVLEVRTRDASNRGADTASRNTQGVR